MEHIHIIINLNVFSLKQAFDNYGWLYLSLVYKRYIQVYWCALTFKSEHKRDIQVMNVEINYVSFTFLYGYQIRYYSTLRPPRHVLLTKKAVHHKGKTRGT